MEEKRRREYKGDFVATKTPVQPVSTWKLLRSVRFLVSLLVLFAALVQYAAKVDLSVNIVCMVNHTAVAEASSNKESQLPKQLQEKKDSQCGNLTSTMKDGIFVWDKGQQAHILAAFFYGYLISEIPGGLLAERYGSKLVIGFAVVLNSLCAWHYGVGALNHYGYFIFMRILVGFGCGVMLPAISHIWTAWAPATERSFLIGVALSGAHFAPMIMLPIGGIICSNPAEDWKTMFFIVAGLEVIWVILWFALYSDSPFKCKFISEDEIAHIQQTLIYYDFSQEMKIPWKPMLKSAASWALFICHTLSNWGLYTLLTEIPSYMKYVLKFDLKSNGLFSALPYMVIWITTTSSSYIADRLLAKNILSRTYIRKIAVVLGTFCPAVFLIALGFTNCTQRNLAVALLAIGQGLFGITWGAGHMCNANDLAPVHAGVLFGISNTLATIPGIVTPHVTAAIVGSDLSSQSRWQIVFAISSAFFLAAGVVFAIFGDGTAQRWDSDHQVQAHTRSISSMQ